MLLTHFQKNHTDFDRLYVTFFYFIDFHGAERVYLWCTKNSTLIFRFVRCDITYYFMELKDRSSLKNLDADSI